MRFKISALTALLAASTPVYAQDISGTDVIQKLDFLTESARNLSSVLLNTQDPVKIGQAILSSTKDLVAEIPHHSTLEGLGHILFDDADQSVICNTLRTFHPVNMAFIHILVRKMELLRELPRPE
ncbi:hypothetical protein BDV38DRAFT_277395 [Aspergillus pseudotamarii]|uniref:Hydrophobic surface binding protein A-domain-containing protein n=1 Tax=Aspergillus pseudotamarii TaxID=132259 RepID=A0A5N6TAR6_ASPPS|nr:uncharacterized protein BDV38DRAFT_277395 [Aspergillus pseudotamarii]KAE8143370.1 hypothetical protein BDV38DRAFT_277395 [Aspergillus pseudotamarii]